jgi:transcription elongation factor GreA
MSMDKVPMTAEGYAALEAEINHLKTVERPRIIERSPRPAATATFPRTPSITPPRKPRASTRARRRTRGQAVARRDHRRVEAFGQDVKFGATVTLIDEDTDEKVKYQIVGDVEAT